MHTEKVPLHTELNTKVKDSENKLETINQYLSEKRNLIENMVVSMSYICELAFQVVILPRAKSMRQRPNWQFSAFSHYVLNFLLHFLGQTLHTQRNTKFLECTEYNSFFNQQQKQIRIK